MRLVIIMQGLLVGACGRVGFVPPGSADASLDGEVLIDVAPVRIVELGSSSSDEDPTLTSDLLEIYFASNRGGGYRIWRSQRTAVTDAWQAPAEVLALDTGATAIGPELSRDGLTLCFVSGPGLRDVYIASRADRASPWQPPVAVAELSATVDQESPSLDDMQLELFIGRQQGSLWSSSRPTTSAQWAAPVLVTELDSAGAELSAHLDVTGLQLLFASDRAGSRDLWVARRPSRFAPFSPPVRIDAVSSPTATETDPWLSPDGRTLFYKSNVSGDNELYVATVTLP